jgi:hypothetical protein
MIRSIDLAGLVVAAALAGPAAAQEAPAQEAPAMLHLQLPVDCVIGSTCFVQHYVDEDPSEGARDYRCGTLTYDGHDGTDFRVPTLAAQKAGVDVLAAARGRVLRIRDGQPDQALAQFGRDAVKGSECGNGVVIAHAGGFETQYCHLAEDSVAVHPGDPVEAGQRIGRIGQSGLAEFPHLHLTLRKDGKPVDPFRSRATADCGGDLAYWDEAARRALSYSPGSVINRGFATGPVTMAEIEAGTAGAREPGGDAPALVAFIRAIGLRQGDVQVLTLMAPDGKVLAENRAQPLDRNKAQWMMFSGVRRPAGGWPAGAFTARYQVLREGRPALESEFSVDLKS